MLALPLYLFFGGLTIWGIFNPQMAGWMFVVAVILFTCWLLSASWSLKSKWLAGLEDDSFSDAEFAIFRKYAFYFIYPFQAKQYSSTFSMVQALSLVWIVLLLWHGQWPLSVCFVILFFVATNMAPYLNQGNFLRHHKKRGKLPLELLARLALVESVEEKVFEARMKKHNA